MSDVSLMSFAQTMTAAPELRPRLNVGAPFDIPTATPVKGMHGETYLNAGITPFVGICGLPNMYKSSLLKYFAITALDRHPQAVMNEYECEMSGDEARWESFTRRTENLSPETLIFHPEANPSGRLLRTTAAEKNGDQWFEDLKKYADLKFDNRTNKQVLGTLPFKGKNGQNLKAMYPSIAAVDSLSRMPITAVDIIYDKNAIGDSGNNMAAMREMHAKNQMIIQLPIMATKSSLYFMGTAHVSEKHQLDPYAPNTRKLSFLGSNLKLKYVPDQFNFLAQDLYFLFSATKCVTKDGTPQYPRNSAENANASTDLMKVTCLNLRGKYGSTGTPYELIVSQSEGLLPGLTQLHYIKQYGGFGIGGHDKSYYLELYPDVKLSRTTVRSKLDDDPKVRRAMEITCEMLQMKNLWNHLDPELMCEPAELYKALKEKGYDWDVLLNTRGYWVFEETKHPLPFLSTLDLLNMRLDRYKPYWMS